MYFNIAHEFYLSLMSNLLTYYLLAYYVYITYPISFTYFFCNLYELYLTILMSSDSPICFLIFYSTTEYSPTTWEMHILRLCSWIPISFCVWVLRLKFNSSKLDSSSFTINASLNILQWLLTWILTLVLEFSLRLLSLYQNQQRILLLS